MAPTKATLEADLRAAARTLFDQGPEFLTVNAARQEVEYKHNLEAGFFKAPKWKQKSKDVITETADSLFRGSKIASSPAQAKKEPTINRRVKRESTDEGSPVTKRIKTESRMVKKDDSDLSDADMKPGKRKMQKKEEIGSDSEAEVKNYDPSVKAYSDSEDEKTKRKRKLKQSSSPEQKTKLIARTRETPSDTSLSDVKDESDEDNKKPTESSDSDLSDLGETAPVKKKKPKAQPKKMKAKKKVIAKNEDSDSSLSVVDDVPKPKRKSTGDAKAAVKSKPAGKAAADLSPDEAEVKKLQGQLLKCGVRKIWAFELKKYGDDSKAKIRHLKSLLRDIGMDGRFSEARAREIKEMRELQADLEAVQEADKHWGVTSGQRASRSRASKNLKEESNDEGQDEEGDEDDESDGRPTARSRGLAKRRADLAFLGDDSESD